MCLLLGMGSTYLRSQITARGGAWISRQGTLAADSFSKAIGAAGATVVLGTIYTELPDSAKEAVERKVEPLLKKTGVEAFESGYQKGFIEGKQQSETRIDVLESKLRESKIAAEKVKNIQLIKEAFSQPSNSSLVESVLKNAQQPIVEESKSFVKDLVTDDVSLDEDEKTEVSQDAEEASKNKEFPLF